MNVLHSGSTAAVASQFGTAHPDHCAGPWRLGIAPGRRAGSSVTPLDDTRRLGSREVRECRKRQERRPLITQLTRLNTKLLWDEGSFRVQGLFVVFKREVMTNMTHRYHPDPEQGDPPEAILYDDCERCAEHAKDPRGLDRERLLAIVRVCDSGEWDHRPTENERKAEGVVYRALCLVETLTELSWKQLVGGLSFEEVSSGTSTDT